MAIRIVRPASCRGIRQASSTPQLRLQRYNDSATSYTRVAIPPEIAKKAGLLAGMRADFYIDDEEHIFGLLPSKDGRLKLAAQSKAKANKDNTLYLRGAMPDDDIKYLAGSSWVYDGIQDVDGKKAVTFCSVPGSTDIKIIVKRKVK
jgi:hypothetical protein